MSEKFCIFCGEKPKDKNLEHVIPQWLIRMQGLEKSLVATFSLDGNKNIPFMQFKFPACTECNSRYAKLEAVVKPVLERVLGGKPISGLDASFLMDWFEKIRIGLWLSNVYHNQDLKKSIYPHLFVHQSIATSDRMLSIQKIQINEKDQKKQLVWNGTNRIWFIFDPSAFSMVINDYYFLNASHQNMVAPRVGFPKLLEDDNGLLSDVFIKGTHKIETPIIPDFTPAPKSITFYQPIYRDYLCALNCQPDNYVKEHSYNLDFGVGGVFVQQGNENNIRYLQPSDNVDINLHSVQAPDFEQDTMNFFRSIPHNGRTPSFNNFDTLLNIAALNIKELQK